MYGFYSLPRGPNQYKFHVATVLALHIRQIPPRTKYLPVKNTDRWNHGEFEKVNDVLSCNPLKDVEITRHYLGVVRFY